MTTTQPPLTVHDIKWKLLLPWLERQPEGRTFDFINTSRCLLCAFLRQTHGVEASVGGYSFKLAGELAYRLIPDQIREALRSALFDSDTANRYGLITCGDVKRHLLQCSGGQIQEGGMYTGPPAGQRDTGKVERTPQSAVPNGPVANFDSPPTISRHLSANPPHNGNTANAHRCGVVGE